MTQMGTDQSKEDGRGEGRINALTGKVIGCAFRVGSALGAGFLEKVYENALVHELRKAGLRVEPQRRLTVWYDGVVVGEYVADLLVEGEVLVELKAARTIDASHEAQCINALSATRLPICLLLNFAGKVHVRRFIGASAADVASPRPPVPPDGMTWAEAAEFGEDSDS